MKPIPLRVRPLLQTDLFEVAAVPAPLRSLQLHHDELVDLLSRLLWQVVAGQADPVEHAEDDDEQDQP